MEPRVMYGISEAPRYEPMTPTKDELVATVNEALARVDALEKELEKYQTTRPLPCPFCGSKDGKPSSHPREKGYFNRHQCKFDRDDVTITITVEAPTKELAIEAWNTRTKG